MKLKTIIILTIITLVVISVCEAKHKNKRKEQHKGVTHHAAARQRKKHEERKHPIEKKSKGRSRKDKHHGKGKGRSGRKSFDEQNTDHPFKVTSSSYNKERLVNLFQEKIDKKNKKKTIKETEDNTFNAFDGNIPKAVDLVMKVNGVGTLGDSNIRLNLGDKDEHGIKLKSSGILSMGQSQIDMDLPDFKLKVPGLDNLFGRRFNAPFESGKTSDNGQASETKDQHENDTDTFEKVEKNMLDNDKIESSVTTIDPKIEKVRKTEEKTSSDEKLVESVKANEVQRNDSKEILLEKIGISQVAEKEDVKDNKNEYDNKQTNSTNQDKDENAVKSKSKRSINDDNDTSAILLGPPKADAEELTLVNNGTDLIEILRKSNDQSITKYTGPKNDDEEATKVGNPVIDRLKNLPATN